MGFTPYSQVVQPVSFVEPIPLNMLATGLQAQERNAQSNIANIQNSMQKIAGIPAYGKDAEVLAQKMNSALENVNKLSQSADLSDPRVASQLQSYIVSMGNDPDILAIAKRGNLYTQEAKRQQDALEKGKTYISPILDGLTDYYNKGTYYRNPEGLTYSQGFLAPEVTQWQKAAKELTPVKKKWEILPNGERMQVEYQDPNDLASNYLDIVKNSPNGMRYMEYMFDKQHVGVDWDLEGVNKISDDINKLTNAKYEAILMGQDPSVFDQQIGRLQKIQESGLTGQNIKESYFNNYIIDQASTFADAHDYVNQGDVKLDELEKMRIEHSQRLQEINAQALKEGAALKGYSLQEVLSNPAKAQEAMEAKKLYDMDVFSEKQRINLENRLKLKESTKGIGGIKDSDPITYTNTNGETVTLQYKDMRKQLESGAADEVKEMIASIKNQANVNNPSWEPITADDVTVSGKGSARKFKIKAGFLGYGGQREDLVEIMDINNFSPNSQPSSSNPNSVDKSYTNPNDTINF